MNRKTLIAILLAALSAFCVAQVPAIAASSSTIAKIKVIKGKPGKRGPRGKAGPQGPQGPQGRAPRIDYVYSFADVPKATGGYCYLVGPSPGTGPTPATGETGPTYTPAHQVCVDFQPGYKEIVATCPEGEYATSVNTSVFGGEEYLTVANMQPNPATHSGSANFKNTNKFREFRASVVVVCQTGDLYDGWDGHITH